MRKQQLARACTALTLPVTVAGLLLVGSSAKARGPEHNACYASLPPAIDYIIKGKVREMRGLPDYIVQGKGTCLQADVDNGRRWDVLIGDIINNNGGEQVCDACKFWPIAYWEENGQLQSEAWVDQHGNPELKDVDPGNDSGDAIVGGHKT